MGAQGARVNTKLLQSYHRVTHRGRVTHARAHTPIDSPRTIWCSYRENRPWRPVSSHNPSLRGGTLRLGAGGRQVCTARARGSIRCTHNARRDVEDVVVWDRLCDGGHSQLG